MMEKVRRERERERSSTKMEKGLIMMMTMTIRYQGNVSIMVHCKVSVVVSEGYFVTMLLYSI